MIGKRFGFSLQIQKTISTNSPLLPLDSESILLITPSISQNVCFGIAFTESQGKRKYEKPIVNAAPCLKSWRFKN